MNKKLFYNGRIISLDEENNTYKEILIDKNTIVALGCDGELDEYEGDDVARIDLKGKTMIPGFFDTHVHLVEGGRSLMDLNLKSTRSFDDFKKELISYSFNSDEKWIIGSGWDEMKIFKGKMPDRRLIDEIVLNKPVMLIRQDGHSMVMNSKAISTLKLEKSKSLVAPRLEDGSLSGMFYEQEAFSIIEKVMKMLPYSYFKRAIKHASDAMVFNGITGVNDIFTDKPEKFLIYKKMIKNGEIKHRVFASPYGSSKFSKMGFGLFKKHVNDKLRIGPYKYFLDGSFGSNTAFLSEPYSNNPQNTGRLSVTKYRIKKAIQEAFNETRQIAVHAIGDESVNLFLNLYEKEYDKHQMNIRARVEHVDIIKDSDLRRFKRLKLIPSLQPVSNLENELILDRLGEGRIGRVHRFRSFFEMGLKVIFNSDWPFGGGEYPIRDDGYVFNGFEPLLGIHLAVNDVNINQDEQVDIKSALLAYTKNAAYANYMEDFYGTIEKGKIADLTVLSQNPFEVPKPLIKDIKVEMTIVDGKIVHRR